MADRAWMLKETFPHMPNSQRVRNQIYARYNSLRLLRNRIFHFEPIWHRPNLAQQHAQILEAIGWVNPTVRRSLGIIDHFPETYERGQRIIAEMLRDHLDFPEAHPL